MLLQGMVGKLKFKNFIIFSPLDFSWYHKKTFQIFSAKEINQLMRAGRGREGQTDAPHNKKLNQTFREELN